MTPRLALTAGEPAGIGPELLVQIAQQSWPARLIALADPRSLLDAAQLLGLPLSLHPDDGQQREPLPATALAVQPYHYPQRPRFGQLSAAHRETTLAILRDAATGTMRQAFDAIVTAPVQKSALDLPDAPFSGHTEFFQSLCGSRGVVMMLVAGELRVALATTHLPLRAVADAIQPESLAATLSILHAGLRRDYGLAQPRIAVLGLNPHAGEAGHLGREEIEIIEPTLARLRDQGMALSGPWPADTAFAAHRLQHFDAVLAMYHDQGLPTLKYAGFGQAVNVSLGLPIVRTSVDHGTALDLAGSGKADAGSMRAAIQEALRILGARQRSPS